MIDPEDDAAFMEQQLNVLFSVLKLFAGGMAVAAALLWWFQ